MSLILSTLRSVGGLLKYSLQVFAITLLAVDLLYGLILVMLAFWIASDGSTIRGVLAGIVAAILAFVLGFIVASKACIVLTLSRAIQQAAVGRRVFDAIFDRVLGVSDEQPEGCVDATQAVHVMPVTEVKSRLKAAGDKLLAQEIAVATMPRIAVWFARRIQRVLVWAIIHVVLRSCTSDGPDPTVDLIALRAKLADVIDREVTNYLKQHAKRLLLLLAMLVACLAGFAAYAIRQLPF